MKLFLRIFLSFWIATALMIVVVAVAADLAPLEVNEERAFEPETVRAALTAAVNDYEQHGRAALEGDLSSLGRAHHRRVFLFDENGSLLSADGPPPLPYANLAIQVRQEKAGRFLRFSGLRTVYACSLQSATGRRYSAVITVFEPGGRLLRARFWTNVTLATLPAALVCMLLSLYITRPITRLRATAQRLASGDLSARSSSHRIARRDELGDLARDFDVMAAQIERLMTAQRRFVADVSHELGAPLTRMHLALALLRRHSAGKSPGELERIERETDKLSNLVQQLLLLAGLEAGRCPTEAQGCVSLRSLCESLAEDANFEAAHAGCRVGGARDDITLLAYPQLLRRAIDNVLRNAIRYAPPGSEVVLNASVDREQQRVVIEILDRGPGVPEAMLADIFRPFFRTSPGRESATGGTGLGLAIASEAVQMHDGTISARNREGGGLCVTLTLPMRAPESDTELQAAAEPSQV
jgi:two-component system, OmpR family, sensor histidine kinase CpxA